MFFLFSKIFAFLLNPLFWILLMLAFSQFYKNPAGKRKLIWSSIVLLYIFSNSFLLDEVLRLWEYKATPDTEISGQHFTAIVPGGYSSYDPSLQRIQFKRPADRIFQTTRLYHQGFLDKIILTGGSGNLTQRNLKEADLVKDFLLKSGIPDSVILTESASDNTYENALNTRELIKSNMENHNFLLFTSSLHMRRAKACFEKAGIKVIPYVTDRYSGPRKFQFDHLLLPNPECLFTWTNFLHEVAGYFVYKLAGYC